MRVLLLGGAGRLGSAVRARWSDCEIAAPAHAELAIERSDLLADAVARFRPDAIVNAAAFHDVDRCERETARAFQVNAVAVGEAARIARDANAVFVTIGTDYVFDGASPEPYAESDAPHPLSAYGTSKLAGEYLVERVRGRSFVVRTCGVYGAVAGKGRPDFVERIAAQARAGAPVRVVSDVVASPTFAGDLADALRSLLQTEAYGLYHAVNGGAVSWFDFAREVLAAVAPDAEVEPIAAADWKAPAVRPRFSALDNGKLRALGVPMPSWRDGIAAYLRLGVR